MNSNKTWTMDIKGAHFIQSNLPSDLRSKTLGQRIVTKFWLFILILVVCFIAGFLSGLFGSLSGLYIIAGTEARVEFSLAVLVTFIWLISSIYQAFNKNVLVVAISIASAMLIQEFARRAFSSTFTDLFWLSTFVSIMYVLTFVTISFFSIRFATSLFDIIFAAKSNATAAVIFFITSCAAVIGSIAEIYAELSVSESNYRQQLLASTNLNMMVILCGVAFSSAVTWSALTANRFHRVPWSYPSLLRSWALAVGTWGGTSFYSLDLSNVDFREAKLANTDLRAQKLYRTCFQGVVGLERARVDNQYLDLAYPKVQKLLTHGTISDLKFIKFNLQGAYLRNADMRGFDLSDTNLTGADLKAADLRGSQLIRTQLAGVDLEGVDLRTNILTDANLTEANLRGTDLRDCILVRAQVARADFSGADLTGACIEDWSVSSKTTFTDVRCDYVFRQYENGQPTHRYPSDRNFEAGEFAALFQQPENELELIFKGSFSYSALSLAFYKLKTEKPELDLELKGIEQRGSLWVVHVTSNNPTVEAQLEEQFNAVYQTTTGSDSLETTIKDSIYRDYEDIKQRLAESQQLVRQFAGISESQAEALKQLSKQALGTNFFIEGSNITNLTGQGQIEYTEAAGQIRSLVTHGGTEAQISQGSQQVLTQLQDIATTPPMQTELIQQILLREAENDPAFRSFLLQQQQQILTALPPGTLASAIQGAITQLAAS